MKEKRKPKLTNPNNYHIVRFMSVIVLLIAGTTIFGVLIVWIYRYGGRWALGLSCALFVVLFTIYLALGEIWHATKRK